ncbi:MAG: ABC transporter substrate-binding protein [Acidimicrobiia bacterium]|nr:ABC transporter substrate-binding protein [Acidimicrobiia bacterium]
MKRGSLRWLALFSILALFVTACGAGDDEDDGAGGSGDSNTTVADNASDTTGADGASDTTTADEGSDTTGAEAPAGDPEAAPGFDPETGVIKIGVITDLSGPLAIGGKLLTRGNKIFFEALNAKGGIAGKYKVELVVEDHGYDEAAAANAFNKIKDDVVMIGQVFGTPPTKRLLPLLGQESMLAAPASLAGSWVRDARLLPVGTPYQAQIINGAAYYTESLGSKDDKACAMAADDDYGDEGIEGVEFAAEELGFELTETVRFAATDQDFGQVSQLADCDVVYLISTPLATNGIMSEAANSNLDATWIAMSPAFLSLANQGGPADYMEENLYVIGDGPAYGDTSNAGMKRLMDDTKVYVGTVDGEEKTGAEGADTFRVFGYGQAWGITQILEKAVANGDLSREGIQKAAQDIDLKFDGLFGDYVYGSDEGVVAERTPPLSSTILKVDFAEAVGLKVVAEAFTSDAAKAYDGYAQPQG